MIIFKAYASGLIRSLKAWKGVLIIWLFSLIMVSVVALPMRGVMKAGLGKSMAAEKFSGGLNIEILGDMGPYLISLLRSFSSGLLILVLTGVLVNAFLSGGLFNNLKRSAGRFSSSEFFRASAGNFWSFLGISLIISTILVFLSFFIIGLPLIILSQSQSGSESKPYLVGLISFSVFLLCAAILFLVADYARSWRVTNEKTSSFAALGFGFSRTFRSIIPSLPMMLIILVVQVLFSWVVISILGPWRPATGVDVFLMFIVSQLLFFIKVLLKAWRYGSVTSLMEQNNSNESLNREYLLKEESSYKC